MAKFTLDPSLPPAFSAEALARLDAITPEQVEAGAASDPDNPSLSRSQAAKLASARMVRDVRRASGLSQTQFARAYHVSPGRLRDLEQGRTKMDSATRAYFTLIRVEPQRVRDTLNQAEKPVQSA